MFDLTTDLTNEEKLLIGKQKIECTLDAEKSFHTFLKYYLCSLKSSNKKPTEIYLKIIASSNLSSPSIIESTFSIRKTPDDVITVIKYLSMCRFKYDINKITILIENKYHNRKINLDFTVAQVRCNWYNYKFVIKLSLLNHILYSISNGIHKDKIKFDDKDEFAAFKLNYSTFEDYISLRMQKYYNYNKFNDYIKLLFTSKFGSVSASMPYCKKDLLNLQNCNLFYNYKKINNVYFECILEFDERESLEIELKLV